MYVVIIPSIFHIQYSLVTSPCTGNTIASDVASIKTLVRSMYSRMMELKAEVKNNIISLREDLLNAVNQSVSEINTCLDKQQLTELQNSLHRKLELVYHKQDSTHSKLDSLTATTAQLSFDHQQIQVNISDVECMELNQNLQDNLTHQLEKIQDDVTYIHSELSYTCGGTGGWRRVVYLDMTDSSTICPSGWNMTGYSKRTCGRATDGTNTCDSTIFPVRGGEYHRVCGLIRGYQMKHPNAFFNYHRGRVTTIDGAYVAGVSVTHGTPRNHIWTFAAGISEGNPTSISVCPCDASINISVPSFIGDDYFCESGVNEPLYRSRHYTFHPNDTLWDGEDCLPSSTCCSRRNPPYFVKQLPTSTTNDIEARICLVNGLYDENIAVELVELYIQ